MGRHCLSTGLSESHLSLARGSAPPSSSLLTYHSQRNPSSQCVSRRHPAHHSRRGLPHHSCCLPFPFHSRPRKPTAGINSYKKLTVLSSILSEALHLSIWISSKTSSIPNSLLQTLQHQICSPVSHVCSGCPGAGNLSHTSSPMTPSPECSLEGLQRCAPPQHTFPASSKPHRTSSGLRQGCRANASPPMYPTQLASPSPLSIFSLKTF